VLYGRDSRLAVLVREGLRSDGELIVGDNQPYSVSDASDSTIIVHGEQRGIPHVELEIRQELLARESDTQIWAERLGGVLEEALRHLFPTGSVSRPRRKRRVRPIHF
jgi:predicted N-formylglutamate amidohydrolase